MADQPRISVDTVDDWRRLASNCRHAASDVLDEEIRARRLSSEREALQQHMQEFIARTFAIAQPNLRVNGNSFGTLEDTETFDEALDRRIWSLADTRFQWDKRIAAHRTTLPTKLAEDVSKSLQPHHALDTDAGHETEEMDDTVMLEDSAEVLQGAQDSVEKTTALSEELSQTIPKQQERSERVKKVAAEVKALRP